MPKKSPSKQIIKFVSPYRGYSLDIDINKTPIRRQEDLDIIFKELNEKDPISQTKQTQYDIDIQELYVPCTEEYVPCTEEYAPIVEETTFRDVNEEMFFDNNIVCEEGAMLFDVELQ